MADGGTTTGLLTTRWWWLGLAIGMALVVPLLIGGHEALAALGEFPVPRLALMLAMVFAGWNLNAWRLRLLLAGRAGRLGQRRALGMVMASEFAICATPGGSGGPATLLLLLARRGLRPARASAVFMVDQCCDLLFFLLALLAIAAWQLGGAVDGPYDGLLGGAMLGLMALLMAAAGICWRLPALLRRTAPLCRPWLAPRRRSGLTRRLLHFRHALQMTLRLPAPILLATMSLCAGHWLLRYSLLYLALAGLGAEVAWAWTFLVQMLAMAAGQLSLLPGGAGAAELGTGVLLMPLTDTATAAAAIMVWRFATYHWYLLAGAPVFLVMAGRALSRPTPALRRHA